MDDYSFCLYPAEPEETHLLPQQENCTTIQIIHHLTWGGLRPLVHVSNESSLTTVVRQISNQSVTSTGTKEASNWLVSRWIEGDSKTFKVGRVSLQQLE